MAPTVQFQLRSGYPFLAEVKRLLLEQTDSALRHLTDSQQTVDKRVHEVRKCFKCLRGTLRLVRDEMPAATYAQLNVRFRDLGRQLSWVRSSAVLPETLLTLQKRFPEHLSSQESKLLLTRLHAWHEQVYERVQPEQLFLQFVPPLQQTRAQLAALPLEADRFPAAGMRRVYARGRRAMLRCQQQPSVETFHDWRKRVKYLRFHMRMLTPVWPAAFACLNREWVALSDLLGLNHDLADFQHSLQRNTQFFAPPAIWTPALNLSQVYRRQLEAQSLDMGARLYAEKPGAFVRRMESYWRVWSKVRHTSAA